MTLYYRRQGSVLVILGNTYPLRDQIKALGATYNGPDRNWRMPFSEASLTRLDELCRRQGGGPLGGGLSGVMAKASADEGGEGVAKESLSLDVSQSAQLTAEEAPGTASGVEGAMSPGLTVSELMARASQAIHAAFPTPVWITAEVQNIAMRQNGIFLELAEGRDESHANATVTVKAIVWRGALEIIATRRGLEAIREVLQDGLKVRVLCRVQLYKDRGQLSLLIEDIDPSFTKGALAMAREKLLRELRAKGLDQAQKRLRVAAFPFRIGLISAAGSRAQSDFTHQLFSLNFPGEVLFCATPMQGEAVPGKVVAALRLLEQAGCDLVVITRGGGSVADLRWFDAAEIAYGIAHAKVPVIAAIGHHDDVVVAEDISFQRQKTPTAAADFVASLFERTRQRIDTLAADLALELGRKIEDFTRLTVTLGERLHAASLRSVTDREMALTSKAHGLERDSLQVIQRLDMRFQTLASSLTMTARETLTTKLDHISALERELTRRDPSPWLEQGWTQLVGRTGMVKRVGDVTPGMDLSARLMDGRLRLKVQHIETIPPASPGCRTVTKQHNHEGT